MKSYDKYDDLYSISKIDDFSISLYTTSVYKQGELLYTSKIETQITYSNQKFRLDSKNEDLKVHLASCFKFDAISNIQDRLILYSIDEENSNNSVVETYRAFFGSTRKNYTFGNNEPWLCNIFKINSEIVRIVFILYNTETMIEFEND